MDNFSRVISINNLGKTGLVETTTQEKVSKGFSYDHFRTYNFTKDNFTNGSPIGRKILVKDNLRAVSLAKVFEEKYIYQSN